MYSTSSPEPHYGPPLLYFMFYWKIADLKIGNQTFGVPICKVLIGIPKFWLPIPAALYFFFGDIESS